MYQLTHQTRYLPDTFHLKPLQWLRDETIRRTGDSDSPVLMLDGRAFCSQRAEARHLNLIGNGRTRYGAVIKAVHGAQCGWSEMNLFVGDCITGLLIDATHLDPDEKPPFAPDLRIRLITNNVEISVEVLGRVSNLHLDLSIQEGDRTAVGVINESADDGVYDITVYDWPKKAGAIFVSGKNAIRNEVTGNFLSDKVLFGNRRNLFRQRGVDTNFRQIRNEE